MPALSDHSVEIPEGVDHVGHSAGAIEVGEVGDHDYGAGVRQWSSVSAPFVVTAWTDDTVAGVDQRFYHGRGEPWSIR